MGDAKDSWMNEVKDNRVLKDDGNYYWIMRVNGKDAAARGIADGDLIRAFNDRGSVILAAQVTERVPPGTVHSYESCGDYQALGEPGHSPDICRMREHPHAQALHHARPRPPWPTTPASSRWRNGTVPPGEDGAERGGGLMAAVCKEVEHGHRRRPVHGLQRLLPGRQGRVHRQRLPALFGGPALEPATAG